MITKSSKTSAAKAAKNSARDARGASQANAVQRKTARKSRVDAQQPAQPASATAAPITKSQTCIELLGRPDGATITELQRATGWQAHSVRGFLSGALKKRMRLCIMSDKAAGGERRYRISAPTRS